MYNFNRSIAGRALAMAQERANKGIKSGMKMGGIGAAAKAAKKTRNYEPPRSMMKEVTDRIQTAERRAWGQAQEAEDKRRGRSIPHGVNTLDESSMPKKIAEMIKKRKEKVGVKQTQL